MAVISQLRHSALVNSRPHSVYDGSLLLKIIELQEAIIWVERPRSFYHLNCKKNLLLRGDGSKKNFDVVAKGKS